MRGRLVLVLSLTAASASAEFAIDSRVVNVKGDAVQGVLVTLVRVPDFPGLQERMISKAETDASGRVTLSIDESGFYAVRLTPAGFIPVLLGPVRVSTEQIRRKERLSSLVVMNAYISSPVALPTPQPIQQQGEHGR